MNYELRVNPIACDGHGVCAELLPEMIELDPWGYPILKSAEVPRGLVEHARRAAAACPVLALALVSHFPRVTWWMRPVANQHWQRLLEPLFTSS